MADVRQGTLFKIWDVQTMGKANDAQAAELLNRAANQVKPIMFRRQWKV